RGFVLIRKPQRAALQDDLVQARQQRLGGLFVVEDLRQLQRQRELHVPAAARDLDEVAEIVDQQVPVDLGDRPDARGVKGRRRLFVLQFIEQGDAEAVAAVRRDLLPSMPAV